jgi:hypothetical protein
MAVIVIPNNIPTGDITYISGVNVTLSDPTGFNAALMIINDHITSNIKNTIPKYFRCNTRWY